MFHHMHKKFNQIQCIIGTMLTSFECLCHVTTNIIYLIDVIHWKCPATGYRSTTPDNSNNSKRTNHRPIKGKITIFKFKITSLSQTITSTLHNFQLKFKSSFVDQNLPHLLKKSCLPTPYLLDGCSRLLQREVFFSFQRNTVTI